MGAEGGTPLVVYYLSLQGVRSGTAAHAHVHEIVEGLRKRGVWVGLFAVRYTHSAGAVRRILTMLAVQLNLVFRLLIWRTPDFIYVRHHFAALPTFLAARLWKVPLITEVNGPTEDLLRTWNVGERLFRFLDWISRWQCRAAQRVITVTPGFARWFEEAYGLDAGSVAVIPNGANVEMFKPLEDPDLSLWPQLRQGHYVIFVGALTAWHGIATMLQAVDNPAWPDDVLLAFVGEGHLKEKVSISAKRKPAVVDLGIVPYDDIPRLISGALAGLCLVDEPMRLKYGVSPLKLYEYLACACPVIVSEAPGQADLVREAGAGFVIPPSDSNTLCHAVKALAEDGNLRARMGEAGCRTIREYHSWDHRAEETYTLLKDTVRQVHPQS